MIICNYLDGDLDEDLNLRLGKIRSTSIEVIWDTAEQAQSYIVYVQNVDQPSDEKTIAVNAALNEYTLENLIPGSAYEIGSKFQVFNMYFLVHNINQQTYSTKRTSHFTKKYSKITIM